jgi:hypothetical protein
MLGSKALLRGESMLDVIFVVVTLAFFGLSWLYVRAIERI